ncbi:MAG TPA: methylmalonyl-CoA epimerase [Candidatus Dormibacteraeota bacterium]|jgi:methylmalonyl-CoA epimerase|nr:methylmalonyl-CoA epimerase [Candidatus Dormibacteraeota bacterium]
MALTPISPDAARSTPTPPEPSPGEGSGQDPGAAGRGRSPLARRVSHLGVAVEDLEAAIELYGRVLGLPLSRRWVAEADRIEVASFRAGDLEIELMRPLDEDSPVARFLARRGPGLHHVAFEVEDVGPALERARAAGLESVDEHPRPGGGGRTRVAFLHPRSTLGVLMELEAHVG